jgi:hypothetical protein
MADPIFVELLAALDIVIMERLPDRSFRVLGAIPDWFLPIHTAASGGDTPELERAFPFLDHFLEEAAVFWRQPNAEGRLRSGPYTAKDAYGVEFHFEVSTVLAERRIFLLFHLLRDFEQTRNVFQRARERTLELQKVGLKRSTLLGKTTALVTQVDALLATPLTAEQAPLADKIRRTSAELAAGIEALPEQP